MKYQISCPRCGCSQASAPDTSYDWDEIHCEDCGEFLDTCGLHEDRHTGSYALRALNMSRSLILQMARENESLNDTVMQRQSA
ncbi:hypothetical protein [Salinicola avicenniae]|uniref:hypothetical protein n=1 Tax=Salinicola avicenniae TaxID=2916836 RepID=UPI0020749509|nr:MULTISPECIES: hypothetical protein [unclassified Salinicola]